MHDHDEHNRRETDDQSLASVLKALTESVAEIQFLEKPLNENAPRERCESLILETKLRNTLAIGVNL
jgi:hypothetical protein